MMAFKHIFGNRKAVENIVGKGENACNAFENIVGKERNICYCHFLLLSCFFFSPMTLYRTMLTFHDPREEGFGKNLGKRRKCLEPAFSPLP